jgi:hypothetical protein
MAPFDLASATGPWVVVTSPDDPILAGQLAVFGGVIRRVDGVHMTTEPGLFGEFARVLGFPGYFGRNWDAMVDCLDDLHGDWHGKRDVAVLVDNAQALLATDYLSRFVSVLCQAAARANSNVDADGEPELRPAIALHFVLLAEEIEPFAAAITLDDEQVVSAAGRLLVG